MTLAPGQRHAVATGFAIAIPAGYEVQVRPRSGLALKHGITCLNTPGTIDQDYRGEVKVILANLGSEPFEVRRGERIAQLVPAPVQKAAFREVAELSDNEPRSRGLRLHGAVNLTDAELERYARHIVLPQVGGVGQRKLKAATVAVVGAGGIGSAVIPALAGAGVGQLTIIDFDVVELANLHRQPLFRERDEGYSKADLAAAVRPPAQPLRRKRHPCRSGSTAENAAAPACRS